MSNKQRHVLGLSGGKDSAALAVHGNNNYQKFLLILLYGHRL